MIGCMSAHVYRVGQNHIRYIRCIGIRYFWQGNYQIYTVLANPTRTPTCRLHVLGAAYIVLHQYTCCACAVHGCRLQCSSSEGKPHNCAHATSSNAMRVLPMGAGCSAAHLKQNRTTLHTPLPQTLCVCCPRVQVAMQLICSKTAQLRTCH